MEISFGNKGIYHYIDAEVGTVASLEEAGRMYQVYMLVENNLSFVLHSDILCVDGKLWLTHNTEQCYCMQNMLMQNRINGSILRSILRQIIECIKEMEPYLLDASDLVLCAEYMFWNPVKKQVRLLCVPGYQMSVCEQLQSFLESLMPRFDHTDREGEHMLYMCHQIVSDAWQGLAGLMRVLEETDEKMENIPEKMLPDKSEGDLPGKTEKSIPDESAEAVSDTILSKRVLLFVLAGGAALALIIKYLFFDGTTGTAVFGIGWLLALIVLAIMTVREKEDDSDAAMQEYKCEQHLQEDCILQKEENAVSEYVYKEKHASDQDICTKLVPLTNGALSPLLFSSDFGTVTIGRDRKTDYRVQTTQVSRMHAKIYNTSEGVFLEDLNSTNGTFVNAKRIPALTEYKLNKGDIVGFANEEFFIA